MTLLLAIILCQSPVASASVAKADSQQATKMQSSAPLVVDGDNQPTLQAFIDSLPAGTTVKIPAGKWPLHSPLQVNKSLKLKGDTALNTIFVGRNSGAGHQSVLNIGKWWKLPVNNVEVRDLSFKAEFSNPKSQQNCVQLMGDDIIIERCNIEGSAHEGFVTRGGQRAQFIDCYAKGCGWGNNFYSLPTSAFNTYSKGTKCVRCVSDENGQGFECGGTNILSDGCTVYSRGGYGWNIGSNGAGINNVEIKNCTFVNRLTTGSPSAIIAGNGIGRFANVNIHHCVFIGGNCSVMGGVQENNVHTEWEGPDTGQSHFDDCVFFIQSCGHVGVLGYGTGPGGEATAKYGREPWTFNRNRFYFMQPVVETSTPTIGFGGWITAPLEVKDNTFFWTDKAPTRGDVQSVWGKPGVPLKLTMTGNKAFKMDRTERPFVLNVERK